MLSPVRITGAHVQYDVTAMARNHDFCLRLSVAASVCLQHEQLLCAYAYIICALLT